MSVAYSLLSAGGRWLWCSGAVPLVQACDDPNFVWLGHANASRIFDCFLVTVGHGAVLNMNIAPDKRGLLNESVVKVMHEAGRALNDTFGPGSEVALLAKNDTGSLPSSLSFECGRDSPLVLELPTPGDPFDYVVRVWVGGCLALLCSSFCRASHEDQI